jgi:hypothetical protein
VEWLAVRIVVVMVVVGSVVYDHTTNIIAFAPSDRPKHTISHMS